MHHTTSKNGGEARRSTPAGLSASPDTIRHHTTGKSLSALHETGYYCAVKVETNSGVQS